MLSAPVAEEGANDTAGWWRVAVQIRPEPMGECIAGELRPKQRLVVILCSSMRTNGLLSSSVSLSLTAPSHCVYSSYHCFRQILLNRAVTLGVETYFMGFLITS